MRGRGDAMTEADAMLSRVAGLDCWGSRVDPRPLASAARRPAFRVQDGDRTCFVRCLEDPASAAPALAHARAAADAGLGPRVRHHQPGILVTDFIEGRVFEPADLRLQGYRREILDLIERCHLTGAAPLRGPVLFAWPLLQLDPSDAESRALMEDLHAKTTRLRASLGPVSVVFAHNDWRAKSLIDDGQRLWLVNWERAAYGSALLDLATLAHNNGFSGDEEEWLIGGYHQRIPDAALWHRYRAALCLVQLDVALASLRVAQSQGQSLDAAAAASAPLQHFCESYERFAAMGAPL